MTVYFNIKPTNNISFKVTGGDGVSLSVRSNVVSFKINNTLIKFKITTGLPAAVSGAGSFIVEKFVLSSQNITDKKVTLTYPPVNANYVNLDIVGGCAQDNGTDYSCNVSTKEVSWSGLGLESLLATGDIIKITYSKIS